MQIHTVKRGETLYSIAQEYSASVADIIVYNGLTRFNELAVGQSLIILRPKQKHIVRRGDTLYSIAVEHNTTIDELYRNNPSLNGEPFLRVGNTLVISFFGECLFDFVIGGYMYPAIPQDMLTKTLPYLNYITPFTYGFTPDGELVLLDDDNILSAAANYLTGTIMHLSTLNSDGVFDSYLAKQLLDSHATQEALLKNITTVLIQEGYDGLDIDFEFIGGDYADKYTEFISRAAKAMSEIGKFLITALAPKTADNQLGELYEGHDYGAIGRVSDYVFLMTYEWGYTYGPPMAVAPLPSVRRVLEYANSRIAPQKILLGIPNYGYDWSVPYIMGETKATSISTQRAVELAIDNRAEIFFDENAKTPYFFYRRDGVLHEVWYEDARSIKAKLELVKEYGYRGALYWNFNRPNPQNLSLLIFSCSDEVTPL